jgi:predicted deacetylase
LPAELEYFRPQQGLLDNYNQFVAPRYQLSNQLRTLDQQQRTSFRALEEKMQQSDQIRESRAAVTGTAAGFMNYSHYYGARGGGGAARGGARRR